MFLNEIQNEEQQNQVPGNIWYRLIVVLLIWRPIYNLTDNSSKIISNFDLNILNQFPKFAIVTTSLLLLAVTIFVTMKCVSDELESLINKLKKKIAEKDTRIMELENKLNIVANH
jgi:hypothetical protein